MYIRKASFQGIKGANNKISLDFSPVDNSKIFNENVEDFGIEKHSAKFKVLKQIAIIGLNASGKSTALIGMDIGMHMLCNPFNAQNLLTKYTNIFYDKPFKWFFEFMTQVNDSNIIARKYKIYLTQAKNEITHEKVIVQEISKTSFKNEKVLYELKDKTIIFGDQKFNHNQTSLTLFSLIRTGQVNEIIQKGLSKYLDFFINLSWTMNDNKNNCLPASFEEVISLPKSNKHLKKMNLLLQIFDSTIKQMYVNDLGRLEIEISINNNKKKISGTSNILNILSEGAIKFIKANSNMFRTLTSTGIAFFDKLDASMHTRLFNTIFEILRSKSKSQIIFTTHSTEIFHFNLRLDQIMVLNKTNGIIEAKRVADYEGIIDRDATIKKIQKIIPNSLEPSKTFEVIKAFDE